MGITLGHRSVLCCTLHPQDRDKDVWSRDKAWLRAQLTHGVTHQSCADAFPPSQTIFQHVENSDCEHRTDLGTPRDPHRRSRVPLLCFVTVIKCGVKLHKNGNSKRLKCPTDLPIQPHIQPEYSNHILWKNLHCNPRWISSLTDPSPCCPHRP